eukprot:TRINITY_DN6368_c0_g1_i4.p1 TRINITY_DN6368_c0_g1~~TRINITY_DN6368_c0_g1_i4.p1  ORF type:complete len:134 (-),score=7.30 TRINITY_DN6368_c0_g1_i4:381-782(-)
MSWGINFNLISYIFTLFRSYMYTPTNTQANNSTQSQNTPKKILILDLDETLVHSTTKFVPKCDVRVEVVIEGIACTFYVIKRPHVDHFIDTVCEWYDVVVFTASLSQYANPVIDNLGRKRVVRRRLFREVEGT